MSSSTNGVSTSKHSSLNPNAAEFVPSALRAAPGSSQYVSKSEVADHAGKGVLKRSDSSVSSASDDESKQYWRYRLPDDITPDFGEDIFQTDSGFSGNLDGFDSSLASKSGVQAFTVDSQNSAKYTYPFPQSPQEKTSLGMASVAYNSGWENIIENDQQLLKMREGYLNADECDVGYLHEFVGEQAHSDNGDFNPVEHLATKFPDYASDSLASVYYATGGDLALTTEILTKLELQDGTGSQQSLATRASSAPNLSTMDFPALQNPEALNGLSRYAGDESQQGINSYIRGEGNNLLFSGTNILNNSRFGADFAAVVRKGVSDSSQWKSEKNGDMNFASPRGTQVSSSSFAANSRMINGDRIRNYPSTRQNAPLWLETGDSVASMYSLMRGEARDHARLRNAYFEQARQAYLVGNKALAKELSGKGQAHNGLMKTAHGKAGEAIYRQRNMSTSHLQNYGQGQERLIDLHGLHVSEAIHVLKSELAMLRNTAMSSGQRQQVLICVGTGHHTKGARTPARLPIAVERYLLEEEHLDYTELQPGMLRVALY